jgi:putative SOS response-associated peptidase YedK
MCGRFTLTASGEDLAEVFDLDEPAAFAPRYNIAPSQPVAVVRSDLAGVRRLSTLTWGLLPPGSLEGDRPFINARAETAGERPSFRDAFAERRCLVAADGFYEWEGTGKRRQPWYIRLADGRPFAFAGLWEPPRCPEGLGTCTLLTTEPNDLVRHIHDRMPVILAPGDAAAWLDPRRRKVDELQPLLRSYPAPAMTAYRVGTAVNNARFDDPSCIAPSG